MSIVVRVFVDELTTVLAIYDRIQVHRATTRTGTYSEVTTVITRPSLVAGTTLYEFTDLTGDSTSWYKYRYSNSTDPAALSDFTGPIRGSEALYTSVQSIKDLGFTESDAIILQTILAHQKFIEGYTGRWFVPRELDVSLDGNGSTVLFLPWPVISLSALYANNSTDAMDVDGYKVYSGRGSMAGERDDRNNPRIKIVTGEVDIFAGTGPTQSQGTIFEVGEQNQRLVGTFGYVEADDSTPAPIAHALRRLTVRSLLQGVSDSVGQTTLIEEETDSHRRKWSDPSSFVREHALTGDREVDNILNMYKRPFGIGKPRTPWRRMVGGY